MSHADHSPIQAPARPEPPPPANPLTQDEIRSAFRRPHQVAELVLADWPKITASVAQKRNLLALTVLLALTSALLPMPYAAIIESGGLWKISALFGGSLLICFPSLHIFSTYVGSRVRIEQSLVLALVISAVAALFALGFAPILWFLRVTMAGGTDSIALTGLSNILLSFALLAGIGHQARCLFIEEKLRPSTSQPLVFFVWWILLAFITYRMSVTLEI